MFPKLFADLLILRNFVMVGCAVPGAVHHGEEGRQAAGGQHQRLVLREGRPEEQPPGAYAGRCEHPGQGHTRECSGNMYTSPRAPNHHQGTEDAALSSS